MAGRREVMDPRNSLVFEWLRLVLEIRPKTIMMENVPGLLSMTTPDGLPVIDAIARILADGDFGGYDALKQSLLTTSGAGAALRGKGRTHAEGTKAEKAATKQRERQTAQTALF